MLANVLAHDSFNETKKKVAWAILLTRIQTLGHICHFTKALRWTPGSVWQVVMLSPQLPLPLLSSSVLLVFHKLGGLSFQDILQKKKGFLWKRVMEFFGVSSISLSSVTSISSRLMQSP